MNTPSEAAQSVIDRITDESESGTSWIDSYPGLGVCLDCGHEHSNVAAGATEGECEHCAKNQVTAIDVIMSDLLYG